MEREHEIKNELIEGRNAVIEALRAGRAIDKIFLARGDVDKTLGHIASKAREKGIVVVEADRHKLDFMSQTKAHQGVIAVVGLREYCSIEDIFALAQERGESPFILVCDEISDPHNLGAIIRTAECAGAHGVIVQERRAVGLTPAAVKASAGAVEHLPVARVSNLGNTIIELQNKNIWVYAADMEGENYADADLSGALALVIGAEGEGVSRRVLSLCDKTLSLPMKGKLDSLNASVAAGILLYAAMRAR